MTDSGIIFTEDAGASDGYLPIAHSVDDSPQVPLSELLSGSPPSEYSPSECPPAEHPLSEYHPLESSPPTYSEARINALRADGSFIAKSVTVFCVEVRRAHKVHSESLILTITLLTSFHRQEAEAIQPFEPVRPSSEFPLDHPETLPVKVPELYRALSRFDEAHSDLQTHAKAICDITKEMFDIQREMSKIHEYWLDEGMYDVAHDVLPILDTGESSEPSTFIPLEPILTASPLHSSKAPTAVHLHSE
ncbi:hypothetical protein NMY22_g14386 [Coprinellus aureogranulatus]|nr:hypothetical protein NMY22_g14386 [Coprinellus aureogranulatus]